MKRFQVAIEALAKRPYIAIFCISVLYALFYIKNMKVEYAMFGDMVGRWIQVNDIFQKKLFDYSCNYDQSFDPGMRYYPAPDHFFFLMDGKCTHAYPFPYAFFVAPFLKLSDTYGFYLFNSIFWFGYMFCFVYLAKLLFPNKQTLTFGVGLASFFILPTGIYLFDYSEIMIGMFIASLSMIFVIRAMGESRGSKYLILGGVLSGSAFALRPENTILYAAAVVALFIHKLLQEREESFWKNIFYGKHFIAGIGLILGFLLSVIYHQISFDTYLPARIAHPKSIPESTFANKIKIIITLLVGGNKGLFSSLPFTILSFLYFVPSIHKNLGSKVRVLYFTFVIAASSIILITPGDGGYSWSPRYLSVILFPLSFTVLCILQSGHAFWEKKVVKVVLVLLCIYSLGFTHAGMKILKASTKQVAKYHEILNKQKPDLVLQAQDTFYVMMPKQILKSEKIYKLADLRQIVDFFHKYARNYSSMPTSFTYIWYGPAKARLTVPEILQNNWTLKNEDFFFDIHFDKFVRKSEVEQNK